ncbi:MAG: TonB-dependent receptor [Limisphaerales bacterium]
MKKQTRFPLHHDPMHRARVISIAALLAASGALAADEPAATEVPAAMPAEVPAEDGAEAEAPAEAAEEAPAKTEADYRNWMTVSFGGALTTGRATEFQRRHNLPDGAFGGVQDFHYEQDVADGGLLKVDGRGLFDNRDYGLRIELSKEDQGFVRVGYRQYREWSDGGGGYFPGTGPGQQPVWLDLYDPDLALDRTDFTFEAGLRMPKLPELTVRYTRQTRDGTKDSTIWGDVGVGDGTTRSVVPSFWSLDEVRNIIAADAKKRFGATEVGLGLRYQNDDVDNSRQIRRSPGQTGDARVTQRDEVESDLFSVHGYAANRLSKKVYVSAGYSFMDIDTDTSGYRVYGTAYDPDLAQRLPNPNSFQALSGGSRLDQHLMNVNLLYTPKDSWAIVPSLRVDQRDWEGQSSFAQPAQPFTPQPLRTSSTRGLLDVAGDLEFRYTGITNWAFYARGNWSQGTGDLEERSENLATGSTPILRDTEDERFTQKYTAGAAWYPSRRLNFATEYYRKIRANDYSHDVDSTLAGYPAFLTAQDYTTDDVNFRVSWRPTSGLNLVGRYDFQLSSIDTQTEALATLETAEMTSHILSGNATWNASSRLYLQGGVSYVWDRTETPADEISPAIQRSENDYWTAFSGFGYVLDNKSDLEARYYYYRADNYSDNSAFGLPYGAGAEEHGITATVSRKLNVRTRVSLTYGFFTNASDTSGGNLDYDAHLIYSSLQYRF